MSSICGRKDVCKETKKEKMKYKEYSSKELMSAFTYNANKKKGDVLSYEIILMVEGAGLTITNLTDKKQILYVSSIGSATSLTLEVKTESGGFLSATGAIFKNAPLDLKANEKAAVTLIDNCSGEFVYYFDNDKNKETITVNKKILLNEITVGTFIFNSSQI